MSLKNLLILFTRYPDPGKVKTRLIPALGPVNAAALHKQLAENTLEHAKRFTFDFPAAIKVYYHGGSVDHMRQWLGNCNFVKQCSGDLGAKMSEAFISLGKDGREKIVLIGTDCPDINSEVLLSAFEKLQDNDLVLGPATDGGYYLIGLSRMAEYLFQDMPWGSSNILSLTVHKAKENNLKIDFLPVLADVDEPQDLPVAQQYLNKL